MKKTGLAMASWAIGGLIVGAAGGARGENPYDSIVARNAFALKPPPPPPNPADDPKNKKDPPARVALTGITILDHQKKAWFSLTDAKTPNAPAKYVSLREGQKSGDLEVIEIQEKIGEVRIAHAGENTTVSLKDNKGKSVPINIAGAPPPGVAAPPAIPGRPGAAPSRVPGPAAANQPSFQRRFGGAGRGGNSGYAESMQQSQIAAPIAEPTVSATFEQAVQNLENQRAATQEAVNAGTMPPLPPLPPDVQNALPQLPSIPQVPIPGAR